MEDRLRQAELQLRGSQQEAAALRANTQEVAGVRREVTTLEQQLNQVRCECCLRPYVLNRNTPHNRTA